MVTFLYFFIFSLFLFFIPGFILIHSKEKHNIPTSLFLGTTIGVCVFILSGLILRFLHIPVQFLYILTIFSVVYLLKKKLYQHFFSKLSFSDIFAGSILIVLSALLVFVHMRTGYSEEGLILSAARDSLWRLSIISELVHHFPPQFPGFAGVMLKNYHFYYDFLVATTYQLTGISIIQLYFFCFSSLSAFLFVLGVYALLEKFTKQKIFSTYGTILTVLTGNISYILPYFSDAYNFFARSNIFMSDQPFDQGHNPFNLFSYALVLSGIFLFMKWQETKKFQWILLNCVLFSVAPGVKIYAAIALVLLYGTGVFFETLLSKSFDWKVMLPLIALVPSLKFISGSGFSILSFNPGWLLVKMIEDHDRLFLSNMTLRESYYRETGNYLRLSFLKIEQLLMYIFGNLNVRILGFGALFFIFKDTQKRLIFLLLGFGGIGIALIPLLFSQKRGVYDSIQFTPYALIAYGLLTVLVLHSFFKKFHTSIYMRVGFLAVLMALAIPTNAWVFLNYTRNTGDMIKKEELDGLAALNEKSNSDDVILTDLSMQKMEWLYVPALSARRVFLSGISLIEQSGVTTSARKKEVEDFFFYDKLQTSTQDLEGKRAFLSQNHISYIYLSEDGLRYRELLAALNLEKIYDSNSVLIYKTYE